MQSSPVRYTPSKMWIPFSQSLQPWEKGGVILDPANGRGRDQSGCPGCHVAHSSSNIETLEEGLLTAEFTSPEVSGNAGFYQPHPPTPNPSRTATLVGALGTRPGAMSPSHLHQMMLSMAQICANHLLPLPFSTNRHTKADQAAKPAPSSEAS